MIPATLLPEDLLQRAFIAGGWAVCPTLASDMDVWVWVDTTEESLSGAHDRILMWLEETMWPYEPLSDSRMELPASFHQDGTYGDVGILKVAVVRSAHLSHPYHIMVVDKGPVDLLEHFDISTHQVALVAGNVVKGSGWTPVTEPPRVLRMTPTTPARMAKIAARYGHTLVEPTTKAPEIDHLLTDIAGISRQDAAGKNVCVLCKKPHTLFNDALSAREADISGLCQTCQDAVFSAEEPF